MTDTVKIFKNTAGTAIVPADMNAAIDYTIYTTSASQRAVIKDVEFKCGGAGKARVTPVLDLDGYTAATGATGVLSVDGNLIMGPSSTLKIKGTVATGYVAPSSGSSNYFKGMFFTEGSTGMQFIEGNGADTASLTPLKRVASGHACDDATGAIVKGTLHGGSASGTRFYYRLYNNNIKKYNEAGTEVHSWTYGSTGYALCNDGTYIYRSAASGSTTSIYRTKMSDQTETTLTTNSAYQAPQGNQGCGFHYHDGKLYSKREGGHTSFYIIDLATLNVTTKNDANFNSGSYCDGGFVTVTTAGKAYVVEAGDGGWWYYDIAADTVTRNTAQITQSSTEYAQGGAEVAIGIGVIFGEQSDRATTINMNTKTWTTESGSHSYTTDYAYGDRFGFAGILGSTVDTAMLDFNYEALVSGVEVT